MSGRYNVRWTQLAIAGFEDGESGYEPRNAAAPRSQKRQENDSSLEPPVEPALDFSPVTPISRLLRRNVCCFKSLTCGNLLPQP